MLSVTCYPGNIRLPGLIESVHHLIVRESSGIEDNVSMHFTLPVIYLWVSLWSCFNVESCISLQVIRVKQTQGIQDVFCCLRHIYFHPWCSSWFLWCCIWLTGHSPSLGETETGTGAGAWWVTFACQAPGSWSAILVCIMEIVLTVGS